MSLSLECARHEGQTEGKIETIGGIKCYVATPSTDYPKDKVILFLTDIFGITFSNNQLLADDFARNGFKVIMPDYFEGDPIAPESLNDPNFDLNVWRARHQRENCRPILDKTIQALKTSGITTFAGIGYCFGARYAFDLGIDNLTQFNAVAHASALKSPEDFDSYLSNSKAPLLIISCEFDSAFPAEFSAAADRILGDGKFSPGYKRVHFEGCKHGFAVRADLENPSEKAGKEGAFKVMVEWLAKNM